MRGIPIGLLLGAAAAYLAQRDGWDWKNTIVTAIGVTIADLITVLISIRKPAKVCVCDLSNRGGKIFWGDRKSGKKGDEKTLQKAKPHTACKTQF